jgi:hypothetical protein
VPHVESIIFVAAVFLGWLGKRSRWPGITNCRDGCTRTCHAAGQAVALLVIPSLVTNIWQFATGPAKLPIIRRLTSMMLFVCFGTVFGISFLTGPSRWSSVALGAVLVLYALLALFLPKLTVPALVFYRNAVGRWLHDFTWASKVSLITHLT